MYLFFRDRNELQEAKQSMTETLSLLVGKVFCSSANLLHWETILSHYSQIIEEGAENIFEAEAGPRLPLSPWRCVPSLVGCRSMVSQHCSLLPQILHSFLKWCHCETREVKELYPLWLRRVFNWCLLHPASDSLGTMLKAHCSLTTADQDAHTRCNGFRHSAQFPRWLVSACHLYIP